MCNQGLYFRKIEEADIALMNAWLHKPYILHWYEDPEAWIDEIKQRNGDFAFIHHFIVMEDERPIGFCQYYDCYNAGEEWYSVHTPGETYSIDYLIGEEQYLRKGYGKKIIRMLINRIREETQAKEIIVQPEEENMSSCKTLVSCGFKYDKTAAYFHLNLQNHMIAEVINEDFRGCALICKNNKTLLQKAYGYADLPNKIQNQDDTKFATASAGKVFVAVGILQLIEKGLLHFDDKISKILDFDLKQIDPNITIEQLLTHTSGIPDYFDESVMDAYEALWVDFPNYKIRSNKDLLPLFVDKPMMYPCGTKFQYNNTGFVVLALVIKKITGLEFDQYLNDNIFTPCRMYNTGYYELDRLPAKCATNYIHDEERNDYRTNIFSVDAKGTGAGGAFTTVGDIKLFWECLLSYQLLSSTMTRNMLSHHSGEEKCYGYGIWLKKAKDSFVPYFQGCDPGVSFISSYDTEKELMVVLVSNYGDDVWQLLHEINGTFE